MTEQVIPEAAVEAMSERDELARVIDLADEAWQKKVVTTTQEWSLDIADALIAVGCRLDPK